MHFDDRLETTLGEGDLSGKNAVGQWRQLIDILAQNPIHFAPSSVANGLIKVHEIGSLLPKEDRLHGVNALHGRIQSPPLIQLLSADDPQIANSAIIGAKLSDEAWADLIPRLTVRARGFLRNRNDLGIKARRALQSWSSADFILPNPESNALEQYVLQASEISSDAKINAPEFQPASAQDNAHLQDISQIVARIEMLRKERENAEAPYLPFNGDELTEHFSPIDEIHFETDDFGIVTWVEGAPRGAVIGVNIAEPAYGDAPGPDAHGAAAFKQRMPLENIRMRLCGATQIAGDWRINASPYFEPHSGRFSGYRGIFRRPNAAENAQILPISDTVSSDHVQQLVHELRTPLGAIIGFSEIIEQQLFGPVSFEYRTLAHNIHSDAERLLAGFDDLAMAARIESGRFVTDGGVTACNWLVNRLADRLRSLSDNLNVTLNLTMADPVRPFASDSALTERIFSRLLSAIMIGCDTGDQLDGRFRTEIGNKATNRFVLSLPTRLQSMDEPGLFGSGIGAQSENEDTHLLGLGFSLRLVRNLAQNVGGDLRFYNNSLILSLPAAREGQIQFRSEGNE